MRLNDERYQWIYDNIDRFKQALVTLDFIRKWKCGTDSPAFRRADEQVHDLAFSFLMIAIGEHIPTTLWSVNDYSVLYGLIMDADMDVSEDG